MGKLEKHRETAVFGEGREMRRVAYDVWARES